jgi:predicted secreted protein
MDEHDLPADLSLYVGDDRRIELPNHAAGGYRWAVEVTGDCVTADIGYDEFPSVATAGSRASQILHVTALRPGAAELSLAERRSWESGPPATVVSMTVHVTPRGTNGSQ